MTPSKPEKKKSCYPVMDSIQEVIEYIDSQLPIKTRNQAVSLLVLYRNTILQHSNQEESINVH